jgi:hypothetical protein
MKKVHREGRELVDSELPVESELLIERRKRVMASC